MITLLDIIIADDSFDAVQKIQDKYPTAREIESLGWRDDYEGWEFRVTF